MFLNGNLQETNPSVLLQRLHKIVTVITKLSGEASTGFPYPGLRDLMKVTDRKFCLSGFVRMSTNERYVDNHLVNYVCYQSC